ncbi:hypothetical protein [Flavobacterium sp. SM2513]|uniref:hypothetical protein n=1 Tax=Flavobacterium sp. SM2513 TaxID=3424766 RepID=UPI003D7F5951
MARQVGKIRITGTIAGVNYYCSEGDYRARKAGGGFTRDAIKNKPSMEPVRESGTEFGKLSGVKRLLRESIMSSLPAVLERKWHNDLVSLLIQVKLQDCLSARGCRSVGGGLKTAAGKQMLRDFSFTPGQHLGALLATNLEVSSLGMHCRFGAFALDEDLFKKDASTVCFHYFVVDYTVSDLSWTSYSAEKLFCSTQELSSGLPDFVIADLPSIPTFRLAFLSMRFFDAVGDTLVPATEDDRVGLRCVGVFSGE